ncbi:hypothetical protein BDF14DRAFT_1868838, partial [Spinellus fusiger]
MDLPSFPFSLVWALLFYFILGTGQSCIAPILKWLPFNTTSHNRSKQLLNKEMMSSSCYSDLLLLASFIRKHL